jgi:hypothetical protein
MNQGWSLALLALVGCTADQPPAVVSLPPAPPPPPPIEDALVAVSGRALPESFVADGGLGEWGSLDPPPVEAPRPPKLASRVVVGLGRARVGIAAELRKAAKEGVWLTVAFDFIELGGLGLYQSGGGVSPDQACAPQDGSSRDDVAIKKCTDDLEARQRDFHTRFAARFRHVYRIDKSGVRLWQDQKLVAIAGVKFVAKEHGDASIIEAELPLSALPRVAASPVTSMNVGAAIGDAPTVPANAEVSAFITPEVAFAPLGDLRSALFEGFGPYRWRYHYQPGESLDLGLTGYGDGDEESSFDGMHYVERTVRIFTPQRTFGAFQIGFVYPAGIASFRGDTFVSVAKAQGSPLGMIERNGELHVFFYGHNASSDDWREHGYWTVLAVDQAGAVAEEKLEMPANEPLVKVLPEFHAPDFSSFGYDGEQGVINSGVPFHTRAPHVDVGCEDEGLRLHDEGDEEAAAEDDEEALSGLFRAARSTIRAWLLRRFGCVCLNCRGHASARPRGGSPWRSFSPR